MEATIISTQYVTFPKETDVFPGLNIDKPERSAWVCQVSVRGFGRNALYEALRDKEETISLEFSSEPSESEIMAALERESRHDAASYRVGD